MIRTFPLLFVFIILQHIPAQSNIELASKVAVEAFIDPNENFTKTKMLSDNVLRRSQRRSPHGSLQHCAISFTLACRNIMPNENIKSIMAPYNSWVNRKDYDAVALESVPSALSYIVVRSKNRDALRSLYLMEGDGALATIIGVSVSKTFLQNIESSLDICKNDSKTRSALCYNLALACWNDSSIVPKIKGALGSNSKHKHTAKKVLNTTLQLFNEMGH